MRVVVRRLRPILNELLFRCLVLIRGVKRRFQYMIGVQVILMLRGLSLQMRGRLTLSVVADVPLSSWNAMTTSCLPVSSEQLGYSNVER